MLFRGFRVKEIQNTAAYFKSFRPNVLVSSQNILVFSGDVHI